MLVSRITQLTKDDVIEEGRPHALTSTGTASCCRHG
jgi:hypothetical protein